MRTHLLYSVSLLCLNTQGQWQHTNNPNSQIGCIAAQGSTLLVGAQGGGVYVSNDNAATWSPSTSCCVDFTYPYILCVLIDGTDLYAGTINGLYRSTDNGGQWDPVSNGLIGGVLDTVVSDILRDGPDLFAALNAGVFRSTDNAASWMMASNGFSGQARSLVKHGPHLFAGSYGAGIFRSSDNGASWIEANTGLTNGTVNDLLSVGGDLYLASEGGIFRSSNNGDSWTEMNNGILNMSIRSLIAANGHIYAASFGGGVYVSTNGGENWATDNSGLNNTNMTSLASNNDYLYVGNTNNGTVPGDVFRQELPAAIGLPEGSTSSLIHVYPSPTTGPLTIEDGSPAPADRTVRVLDMLGRQVNSVRIGRSTRITLQLDGAEGVYLIEILTPDRLVGGFQVVKL